MKSQLLIFSFMTLLALPLQGLAQDHSAHGAKAAAGHEAMGGGMKMGGAIMLEEVTESGVKAMVHLMDVSAAMTKMGRKENFHLMVLFTDVKTGKELSEGSVALKITGPGGKAGEPIGLMAMGGQFGSDISLPEKGKYSLEIGSKLADGVKRQFKFPYTMP